MSEPEGYYTMKGFQRQRRDSVTAAMEDYLEMICRVCREKGEARVNMLGLVLHVKPSSVSRMARSLQEAGWISFARYGRIEPTEKGWELGGYLLHRHQVIYDFLCVLNGNENQLEQTERIEHFSGQRYRG